jgi:hypothetical protein
MLGECRLGARPLHTPHQLFELWRMLVACGEPQKLQCAMHRFLATPARLMRTHEENSQPIWYAPGANPYPHPLEHRTTGRLSWTAISQMTSAYGSRNSSRASFAAVPTWPTCTVHVIVGVGANDEGTTDFSVITESRTLISSMQARDTRLV